MLILLYNHYRKFIQHPILLPAVVGCTVLGLGTSLGYNCSYPLNPARDLAPRLFMGKKISDMNLCLSIFSSALSGWGFEVFTGYSHWWLVPVLACHLGGVLGAIIYWLLLHNDAEEEEEDEKRIIREMTMANISSRSGQTVNQEQHYLHVSLKFYYFKDLEIFNLDFQYSNLLYRDESKPSSNDAQCQTVNDDQNRNGNL